MSWVEDARKLMQDFVAPEMRSLSAQIEGIREQIATSDRLAGERHGVLLDKLETTRREILLQVDLAIARQKIEALQAKQETSSQHQAAS